MTQRTPTERIVLFPEPLRHHARGRRIVATVSLMVSLGAAGWLLLRDPLARRWSRAAVAAAPAPPRDSQTVVPAMAPPASPGTRATLAVDIGVDAYADADFDSAAILLRRAVRARGADSLDGTQRVRALTFLAAAELQRGHRDSATSALRQLLIVNPRRPPDPTVFPPALVTAYDRLRARQHGVARIATTADGVALTVVALTPHRLSVGVGQGGGPTAFLLFEGTVRDSVVVKWDGTLPSGASERPGTYELVLVAMPPDGTQRRTMRFPVVVDRASDSGALRAHVPASLAAPANGSGRDTRQFLP